MTPEKTAALRALADQACPKAAACLLAAAALLEEET